jgi:hypothetical protein
MKIIIRGVLLCCYCSSKDPDFMDLWLGEDSRIVALVVHCTSCGKVSYSQCPVIDDEIIVRANRQHWIVHSTKAIMYVNGVPTGYRHNVSELRGRADFER